MRLLRNYPWSSLQEYVGKSKPCGWLSRGPVLAQVAGSYKINQANTYARYIEAGLAKTDEEFIRLMRKRGMAIGSDSFVENVKKLQRQEATKSLKREDVSFRHLRTWKSAEDVEAAVQEIVGPRWEQFKDRRGGAVVRGFTAWALRKYGGLTQRDIAPRVGVSTGAGVSLMISKTAKSPEAEQWRQALDLRLRPGSALKI